MTSHRLPAWLVPAKLVSGALLALGLFFGIGSLGYGLWSNGMPGIGLTSLLASTVLLPASVVLLIEPIRDADREPLEFAPLLCGVGFLLYIAALDWLGFVGPTLAFVLIWARGFYGRSWLVAGAAALAITGLIYVLFLRLLAIPIPLWPDFS